MSEIVDLLTLAWKKCMRDIRDAIGIWTGATIGVLTFVFFAGINYVYNCQSLVTVPYPVSGLVTVGDAWLVSFYYSLFNTLSILTFLLIVVCLFEYALSFTIVCYYYDNCSWVVPNAIRDAAISVWKTMVQRNNQSKDYNAKWRDSLKTEIAAIRAGTYKKEE